MKTITIELSAKTLGWAIGIFAGYLFVCLLLMEANREIKKTQDFLIIFWPGIALIKFFSKLIDGPLETPLEIFVRFLARAGVYSLPLFTVYLGEQILYPWSFKPWIWIFAFVFVGASAFVEALLKESYPKIRPTVTLSAVIFIGTILIKIYR